jgi:hypothetical protein
LGDWDALTLCGVDIMEIDAPSGRAGGEGSSRAATNGSKKPVIIDDDDDDEGEDEADGDEETFAVEKILNHRIRAKGPVPTPPTPPNPPPPRFLLGS